MDSMLGFSCIFLFFLSWGLQGFSQETQPKDLENTLGQGLAGIFQQVQEHGGAATAAAAGQGGASADAMPCMQKLMPCQPFMHSPSPPATCCAPLKDLIAQESQCLCKVFNNPEFLKTVNLTMDEALALSKACGIQVDISVCKNATSSSVSPTTAPSTPSNLGSLSNDSSNSFSSNLFSSNSSSSNSNAGVKITNVDGAFWFIASIAALMFSALYI